MIIVEVDDSLKKGSIAMVDSSHMTISALAQRRSMLVQQLQVPAVHANRFYIMDVDGGYRFTMMEALGPDSPDVSRNAFWLSRSNAEELHKMLGQHLYGPTDELGNSTQPTQNLALED
jgi:hypothetical protein